MKLTEPIAFLVHKNETTEAWSISEEGTQFSIEDGAYQDRNYTVESSDTSKVLVFPAGTEFFRNGAETISVKVNGHVHHVPELLEGWRAPRRAPGLRDDGVHLEERLNHNEVDFAEWIAEVGL